MLKEFQGRKLVGPFDYATQPPVREGVYLFVPPDGPEYTRYPRFARWCRKRGPNRVPVFFDWGAESLERLVQRAEDKCEEPTTERHERYCNGMQWYGLEPTEADKAAMAAQEV